MTLALLLICKTGNRNGWHFFLYSLTDRSFVMVAKETSSLEFYIFLFWLLRYFSLGV